MMKSLLAFFALRDEAHALVSKMDVELAAARASAPAIDLDGHARALHGLVAELGDQKLVALYRWGQAQMKDLRLEDVPVGDDLPPGMVVVDVVRAGDEGVYSGPVNVDDLTLGNLAFIDRHAGAFSNQWGQVFNAKVRFPSIAGVLANAEPDSLVRHERPAGDRPGAIHWRPADRSRWAR
jgi:hypothetical protein